MPDLKQVHRQLQQQQEIGNAYGAAESGQRALYGDQSPARLVKEGELMRKSAQVLPSLGSRLEGRESQGSLAGRSFRDKDSMLSLFQQIPDRIKSQIRHQQ